jgi:hypothetical protein
MLYRDTKWNAIEKPRGRGDAEHVAETYTSERLLFRFCLYKFLFFSVATLRRLEATK